MKDTTVIIIPDTKDIDTKALSKLEEAKGLSIVDDVSYKKAGHFILALGELEKAIDSSFDPIIKAQYAAWKLAIAKKDEHYAPLKEAEGIAKAKMAEYQVLAEKRLKEEEVRLREAAQRAEEEDRLSRANALIEAGKPEEALQLLDAEVEAPLVIMPETSAPKVPGIVTRRVWKWKIVDETKIPREYLVPDEVRIGKMVRASEGKIEIPGVEVYQEREIAKGNR